MGYFDARSKFKFQSAVCLSAARHGRKTRSSVDSKQNQLARLAVHQHDFVAAAAAFGGVRLHSHHIGVGGQSI